MLDCAVTVFNFACLPPPSDIFRGAGKTLASPMKIFVAESTKINCASIVPTLFSMVLNSSRNTREWFGSSAPILKFGLKIISINRISIVINWTAKILDHTRLFSGIETSPNMYAWGQWPKFVSLAKSNLTPLPHLDIFLHGQSSSPQPRSNCEVIISTTWNFFVPHQYYNGYQCHRDAQKIYESANTREIYAKKFHRMKELQTSDDHTIIIHYSFTEIPLYLNVFRKFDVT